MSSGTLAPPPPRPRGQPARPPGPASPPARRGAGDWPRTTRPLPWLIAAFVALLWLVPFDTISLTVSLPFDLHLDRIVLPFVLAAWALTWARRRGSLRIVLTPVHAALGGLLLVAFVSVVLNGGPLAQALELKDAIKHLLLLCSYAAFFFVVATSVRPSEVRPMLAYTVGLAVLCGLGTLVEYRFHTNLFYGLAASLFPHGLFTVGSAYSSGLVDEIGRLVVLGPGEVGLEVASMLAMAVPLAVVGLLGARRRRAKFGYGLAAAVVLAAGVATDEKTSLVAPLIGVIIVVALRPRLARRLVPLVVVMFVAVHALAPGAIGSVTEQFSAGRLGAVGTTQHRQAGYEAIRPLVWSHPAIGMGYGSYNGVENRILDNQMLDNVIDTGVLGEIAFLLVPVSVMVAAFPLARARVGRSGRRRRATPAADAALGCGAIAATFLTVSCLFDDMSFPHVPYIFLTAAGLAAVLWQDAHAGAQAAPAAPA